MAILDNFSLQERVALVTGSARGLGRDLALGLAEAGADLVLLDVVDPEETRDRILELGCRCKALTLDLRETTPEAAESIIRDCVAAMGRLDILVNNAGIIRRAPALEFVQGDWEDVLSINLNSAFYLSQAAARHFTQREEGGGKVINMASMLSFQGGVLVPSYAASKSAIAGLTRALANEWAPLGINVNALAPGYMETEVTAGIRADPERNKDMLSRIPAGRWGDPEDLKGAAVFLASDAASYVHGAILPVDGGWLAR